MKHLLQADPAEILAGVHYLSAEMLYQARPSEPRARAVYDFALHSRLSELSRREQAGVLWLANSPESLASVDEILWQYPSLRSAALIVNPQPSPDPTPDMPYRCQWTSPQAWRLMDMSDRWVRLRAALHTQIQAGAAHLLLPAWDSVWGAGLLERLAHASQTGAVAGMPAVVSPHSFWQHSSVPSAPAPPEIVRATNAAFNRDGAWRRKLERGETQSLWGKMSLIPISAASLLLERADWRVWEDDRELDSVLVNAGYPVRALWIDDWRLYRQALPVFDEANLGRVLERHLHYTLDIPDCFAKGQTVLQHRLAWHDLPLRHLDPRWRAAVRLSERLIAEAVARVQARLERFGCSWVDWGAYRLVAEVGNPFVQVWKSAL